MNMHSPALLSYIRSAEEYREVLRALEGHVQWRQGTGTDTSALECVIGRMKSHQDDAMRLYEAIDRAAAEVEVPPGGYDLTDEEIAGLPVLNPAILKNLG